MRIEWIIPLMVLIGTAGLAGCRDKEDNDSKFAVPAGLAKQRWVPIDGAVNTRDLGGYRTADGRQVRWHVVYRSADLSGLSEQGCADFRKLGVRRVIDLRNRLSATPLFGGDVVCVHDAAPVELCPILLSEKGEPADAYAGSVAEHAATYARVFNRLAEPDSLPMLFHCAAGKDRSGIVAALLLTLLGVDRATVLEDYNLSLEIYDTLPIEAMERLLDTVESSGGIEVFLERMGVSRENQARIRGHLLEDVSE